MKKSTLIIILTVFVLALFTACTEEENPTELRWRNEQTNQVSDITWVNQDGDTDQTWNGDFAENESTNFKEVDLLNGHGECLLTADGSPRVIYYDDQMNRNISLNEGDSETITIQELDTL